MPGQRLRCWAGIATAIPDVCRGGEMSESISSGHGETHITCQLQTKHPYPCHPTSDLKTDYTHILSSRGS